MHLETLSIIYCELVASILHRMRMNFGWSFCYISVISALNKNQITCIRQAPDARSLSFPMNYSLR
jgi:hypothetical protein